MTVRQESYVCRCCLRRANPMPSPIRSPSARILHRCVYPGVAQDLADYRHALAERQGARRKAASQVVQPDARHPSARPDALPRFLEADKMSAPLSAGNDPGIDCPTCAADRPGGAPRLAPAESSGRPSSNRTISSPRRPDRHAPSAGQNVGERAAVQHEQTHRRHRRMALRAFRKNLMEDLAEPLELLGGQEPLAALADEQLSAGILNCNSRLPAPQVDTCISARYPRREIIVLPAVQPRSRSTMSDGM